jgi:apolipoprotein N-acyltransferase
VEKNLLDQTRLAASSGAKIILWQESAGFIPKKEEEVFVHDAIQIAKENKIYLLMTLWSIPEIFPGNKIENKLILIDPNGTIQFTYNKSHAAPPEPILEGKRMLPMINTEYGKLGAAICFDAEFQHFILQAGRNDVDIMFIPANDWKAIDPIHSHMAIMRAVENGFALVHPAGHGLSVASDNRGRILSSMDYFSSEEQIMYADVPTKRGFTIYSLIGDLFAWLCVAGLIWTIWAGFPAGKNRRLSPVQEPKLVI